MDNRLIFLYLLSLKVTDYPGVYVATEVHVEPSLRAKRKQVSSSKKKREKQPVPQTDTGSWDEYSKELERFMAKELGKIDP